MGSPQGGFRRTRRPRRLSESRFRRPKMNVLTCLAAVILMADDKEPLQQAAARLAELPSYTFKGETEFQSQLGNAPPQLPTFDGTYQKDVGLHIKSNKGEMFRKGDRVLIKQGDGAWQDLAQFNPPAPPA